MAGMPVDIRAYLQSLRHLLGSFRFLGFSIQLWVVLVVQAQDTLLKQGQVARVYSNTMVLLPPACLHVVPAPLLLQQIKTYKDML